MIPGAALTPELLAKGYQIKQKAQFTYELWRSPEKRLIISSGAIPRQDAYGRNRDSRLKNFKGTSSLVPREQGDDYEMQWRVHGGKTFGQTPFDEMLHAWGGPRQ